MIKIYNTSENVYHLKNGFILKPKQSTMIDREEASYLNQSFPNCFSLIEFSAEPAQVSNELTQEIQALKSELEALKAERKNEEEIEAIRSQLKELGIAYSPKSKIDVLKEKLDKALAEKEIA